MLCLVLGAAAACGHTPGDFSLEGADGGGGGSSSGGPITFTAPDGATVTLVPNSDGGTSVLQGALTISPEGAEVTVVTGQPVPTQQFTVSVGGKTASGATWILDKGRARGHRRDWTLHAGGNHRRHRQRHGHVRRRYGDRRRSRSNIQTTIKGDPSYTANPPTPGPAATEASAATGPERRRAGQTAR